MRTCAGFSIFLTMSAMILAIFSLVGQTSNNVIPRSIYILTLSTVGLDAALVSSSASLPGGSGGNNLNFSSIYSSRGGTGGKFETRRENRPVHDGLRRLYEFGYFGYCATSGSAGSSADYCTKNQVGFRIAPTVSLLDDLPTQFQQVFNSTLPANTFTDIHYLNTFTHVASILIFTGGLLTILTFVTTLISHHILFLISAILSLLAFLFLIVPLAIYTVVIAKAIDSVNGITIQTDALASSNNVISGGTPLGLNLQFGNAIWIMWSAVGVLLLSVIPLSAACIMGRHNRKLEY